MDRTWLDDLAEHGNLGGEVELRPSGQPARLRVSAAGPGILRLRLSPDGRFRDPVPGLLADPDGVDFAPAAPQVTASGAVLTIAAPELRLELPVRGPRPRFLDAGGRVLAESPAGAGFFWTPAGIAGLTIELKPGTRVLGLGEKTGGLDRRGRRYTFWNTDTNPHLPDTDPLYVSVPFWITLARDGEGRTVATGWFALATGRSWLDAGREHPERLTFACEGDLDLFVIAGPEPAGVLRRYSALTGRMPLPPLWSIGHQHSRWGHGSAEALLQCAAEFRRRGIPCDVLYLDIDHMDGYRVFTWDPARFAEPERLAERLAADGFRLVTIVDPGVKADPGFALYREGLEGGHFVREADGSVYHGDVWPGRCAFPDFLHAEARGWWGSHVRSHAARGVAGIWNDMNEPAVFTPHGTGTFPPDLAHRADDGSVRTHREVHNLYGLMMARATVDALVPPGAPPETPRPFVLTRSGFAGVQRFAAVWTGDNHSWWEHLAMMIPMLAGLGLSGIPFVGADVGGFNGDVEPELLARWYQAAALTPLFRNHSAWNTRRQEPWTLGEEAEEVARRAVALRYRLLPYLYGAFEEAHRTGAPVLRPLLFDHPGDEQAARIEDQYLVGADLLAAPVVQRGARTRLVYLPAGEWLALPDGGRLSGPCHTVVQAPLDRLPLFARAGAVLPLWPVAAHVDAVDRSTLELEIVGHGGEGWAERWLYEDDGATLAHRGGAFLRMRVQHGATAAGYRVLLAAPEGAYRPPRQELLVRLHLPPALRGRAPASVTAGGRELPRLAGLPATSGLAPDQLAVGAPVGRGGPEGFNADERAGVVVIRLPYRMEPVDLQITFS